jgi:hypothetical protein
MSMKTTLRKQHCHLVAVIALLACIVHASCRSPEEFEPDDPYIEAPAPPEIIYPLPDTSVNGVVVNVFFSWTAVTNAESYEIQYDTSLTWPSDWRETATSLSCYISVRRYAFTTIYYCRIRALSAHWEQGFTEWSETRKFYVKPES